MRRWSQMADSTATTARVLAGSGLVSPVRPDRLLSMGFALRRWGVTPATAVAAAAARDPRAVAVIDERGPVTYAEIDRCSNAVARGLTGLGVHERDAVALLARNSRYFLIAQAALAKVGADVIYVNTGFGARQLADVVHDERISAVLADEEFEPVLDEAVPGLARVLAWCDGERRDVLTIDRLGLGDGTATFPVRHRSRHVILTSGTTGKPKGAPREAPGAVSGLEPLVALLGAIPLRARETTVLAAPMFHAWGFAHLTLGTVLQSTLVVRRRFDPEQTLAMLESCDATSLVAVPVMLQRITELPAQVRHRYHPRSLRVVAASGSAIPKSVAEKFMDEFGDVIYNLYGSTEVAYATVAAPQDLRDVPGTAGRPLHGVQLRIVDAEGADVPQGGSGRIFAGNALTFSGYSGGQDKERLDGLVATGDVGRIDEQGRLLIEGRADDMIVSGGENVYPGEVEELLLEHPDVVDAAVVGMDDERFGQALVAHVVTRDGVSPDGDGLRAHVKKLLANYKVPREFVFHDKLPRNETGKVLKRELAKDRRPAAG